METDHLNINLKDRFTEHTGRYRLLANGYNGPETRLLHIAETFSC